MVATVLWVGALAFLATLVIPIGRRNLAPAAFSSLLHALLRRLDPLAWLCLVALIATGLVQMTGNANYDGLLVVDNTWAAAILIKHLVFFGMVGLSAYMTWWILPALRRQALVRARDLDTGEPIEDNRKEINLVRINFLLSIVVLALTAIARTSS
jgi:uncharacterized membrane protein